MSDTLAGLLTHDVLMESTGGASAAVAALISLITPLPYSADFRPFFTIHDEDFGSLASGQLPDGGSALPRLLGVTNLYFLKVPPPPPQPISLPRGRTGYTVKMVGASEACPSQIPPPPPGRRLFTAKYLRY